MSKKWVFILDLSASSTLRNFRTESPMVGIFFIPVGPKVWMFLPRSMNAFVTNES